MDEADAGLQRLVVEALLEAVGADVLVDHRHLRRGQALLEDQRVLERGGAADARAIAFGRADALDHRHAAGRFAGVELLLELALRQDERIGAVAIFLAAIFDAAGRQHRRAVLHLHRAVGRGQGRGEVAHEAAGLGQHGFGVHRDQRLGLDRRHEFDQQLLRFDLQGAAVAAERTRHADIVQPEMLLAQRAAELGLFFDQMHAEALPRQG